MKTIEGSNKVVSMDDCYLIETLKRKPMTTSLLLVDDFGIQHKNIMELIKRHKGKLQEFGKVTFETRPLESGQKTKYAVLNENQALLLLTYTRSTEKTDALRIKLIKQFSFMREALRTTIDTRNRMTLALEESGENERMHGHGFSNYTKYIYKVCGLTEEFRAFKAEYGDTKNFRDNIENEKLNKIEAIESMISGFLAIGKEYNEIKEIILSLDI